MTWQASYDSPYAAALPDAAAVNLTNAGLPTLLADYDPPPRPDASSGGEGDAGQAAVASYGIQGGAWQILLATS
jgi:hypothetical protein